jgi:GT2 family glycosyltransferase
MFTIIVDCVDEDIKSENKCLEALSDQTYSNFEVLLLTSVPSDFEQAEYTRRMSVKVLSNHSSAFQSLLNGDINLEHRGDYVLFLSIHDELFPNALELLVSKIREFQNSQIPDAIIFNSIFKLDSRECPITGWDPDLIMYLDYLQGSFCISSNLLKNIVKLDRITDLYDLIKRVAILDIRVAYIPQCLALLQRPNSSATASLPVPSQQAQSLSIIIPNRNGLALLPKCVAVLRQLKTPYELIIVDNASDDPAVQNLYRQLIDEFGAVIVPFNRSFNYSAMINLGVSKSHFDMVLLLNNDVFVSYASSILIALEYASRPHIGVVGSVLRYSDGTVQHAGIALTVDESGGLDTFHVLRFAKEEEGEHIGALTAPKNWKSVTGAFQLLRRSVFDKVGGYDEINLPVEFNDVDFCLRVRNLGFRVVCLPLEGLVHDESQSRSKFSSERTQQISSDAYEIMRARWTEQYTEKLFVNSKISEVDHAEKAPEKSKYFRKLIVDAGGMLRELAWRYSPSYRETNNTRYYQSRSKMHRGLLPGICIIASTSEDRFQKTTILRLAKACGIAAIPFTIVDASNSCADIFHQNHQPYPDRVCSLYVSPQRDSFFLKAPAVAGRHCVEFIPRMTSSENNYNLNRFYDFDEIWVSDPAVAKNLMQLTTSRVSILLDPSDERTSLTALGLQIRDYLEAQK